MAEIYDWQAEALNLNEAARLRRKIGTGAYLLALGLFVAGDADLLVHLGPGSSPAEGLALIGAGFLPAAIGRRFSSDIHLLESEACEVAGEIG
jgi:hypothetical protein